MYWLCHFGKHVILAPLGRDRNIIIRQCFITCLTKEVFMVSLYLQEMILQDFPLLYSDAPIESFNPLFVLLPGLWQHTHTPLNEHMH